MTDYTTIRVSQDAKAEAQQAKRDNETWNDYIQRCTDEPPEVREFVERSEPKQVPDIDIDIDEIAEELAEKNQSRIDYAEIETRVESVLKEVLR